MLTIIVVVATVLVFGGKFLCSVIMSGLAIDRSILVLTRPVVNTGFNRSLVVDWWSNGRLKRPWSVEDIKHIYRI